jgi:hypothetical protein
MSTVRLVWGLAPLAWATAYLVAVLVLTRRSRPARPVRRTEAAPPALVPRRAA